MILVILESSSPTRKIRCPSGYQSKFLAAHLDDINDISGYDIKKISRTGNEKNINLDSLRRRFRFPVLGHGVYLEPNILSLRSCREGKGRCTA